MKSQEKKEMRRKLLHARNALMEPERRKMSRRILENLKALPEWEQAERVYTYVSYGSEADTRIFIEECLKTGKKVAVPKVLEKGRMEFFPISSLKELKKGYRGILEPEGKEEQRADIKGEPSVLEKSFFLMPGAGFDKKFHRLGYGGGFYDRYLARYGAENFLKIALAFPMQIVETVPFTDHDILMDILVTTDGIWIR